MIAFLDVHYVGNVAQAAAVVSPDWKSTTAVAECVATCAYRAEYEPGRFYLRELQPLLEVIGKVVQPIDVFVIDGYCNLSPDLTPGLGAYLRLSLKTEAAVVGIAKNRYCSATHAIEVLRGNSGRPLFVTAIGIEPKRAAQHIASMAGPYRIPSLLKVVDRLSRSQSKNESNAAG